MIFAISVAGDLHTLAIEREFVRRGRSDFHIIPCDRLAATAPVEWKFGSGRTSSFVTDHHGKRLDVSEAKVVWWRRVRAAQSGHSSLLTDQKKLIDNDCRGALGGILATTFQGRWLSNPGATDRASDKLVQLATAERAGFTVPRTLISQDRESVNRFLDEVGGSAIAKPVVGGIEKLLFTQLVTHDTLPPAHSVEICPTQFQEFVAGTEHIRLNCFGENCFAAKITSNDLDWRQNLRTKIEPWEVDPWLRTKVRNVLDDLGLEMGIFDFKLTPDGTLVWLEINPQGQFLFLESLTGIPLAQHFSCYLTELASSI